MDNELIEALTKRMDAMEKVINEFTNGYKESEDKYNRSEFRKRNADKLGKYSDEFKYWEGDDFDIFDKSYDEFHSDDFKDWSEEDYINKLIDVLEAQLKKNKEHYADKKEEAEPEVTAISIEAEPEKEDEEKAEAEAEAEKEDDSDDEMAEFEAYAKAHPEEGKKYR
jgi:hypothetical protein